MSRSVSMFLASLMLVAFGACTKKEEAQVQPAPQAPPAQETRTQPQPTAPAYEPSRAPRPAATRPATAKKQTPPAVAASRPGDIEQMPPPPVRRAAPVVVPAGTSLSIRLSETLDSSKNRTGDKFEAILDEDLEINERVVARRGAIVNGKVTEVVDSGRVQGLAQMALTLTDIEIAGTSYPIRTNTQSFEAKSSKKSDAIKIGAGAGIGAAIGAIAGGKKGAAIGAATGAGAGTGVVLATKGKDVELASESKLNFRLERDLRIERP